jgi:hypothetical protein
LREALKQDARWCAVVVWWWIIVRKPTDVVYIQPTKNIDTY